MVDDTKSTVTQWMRSPILAGIVGGILITIVLHLAHWGWHGFVEYNGKLSGIYAYSYLALMLLGFIFAGSLSVFLMAEYKITKKKVVSSGILSGFIAGIVFTSSFLYTDILLNPAHYPPFPGDFLKLWTFFQGIGSGWFVLVGIAALTGMIVAAMGALAFDFLRQRFIKNTGSGEDSRKRGKVNRAILIAVLAGIFAILIIPPAIVAIGIGQGTIAQEPLGQIPLRVPDPYTMNESMRHQPTDGIRFGERSVAIAVAGYRERPEDQHHLAYPENYTGQCIMNESMISVSNQLVGREISVGKYLESVCPEYLAGITGSQKAPLYNQSLLVSKIPDREEAAAFVPPLNVANTRFEYHPGWVHVVIYGIFGIAILAIGCVMVRRYRK
jgi:hypothetical protein